MKNDYDIIIIGSGVIGSSIAYHLSERKQKSVLVIDKEFPLNGTTGSTQAWVWVHNKTPSWYGELSLFSAELYGFLEKKIGDVEYKRTGGIAPFFSESDRQRALRLAESQSKVGIKIQVLDREGVLKKEPALSPKVKGATFSMMDGNVNPFRLVELYIKTAKKNQVEFSFHNQVIDIQRKRDTFQVTTKTSDYTTKQLIIAGGPWSKELGGLLGTDIPVKLVRGQILVTEPLAPLLNYTIGGMRQANNGEILIGYSKEEVGYDRSGTLDIIQDTARMAIEYVPKLADANVVRCFSGIRVIPKDGVPIIGELPGIRNAYIAVMHSGITLSPLVGTLMTELILDGDTSLSIDPIDIKRFAKV